MGALTMRVGKKKSKDKDGQPNKGRRKGRIEGWFDKMRGMRNVERRGRKGDGNQNSVTLLTPAVRVLNFNKKNNSSIRN